MNTYDIVVVGAGPAGSTCAALAAKHGLRVALLERARFPRDKVCGDCLNPKSWAILERLRVAGKVSALPQARLAAVDFIDTRGRLLSAPLPAQQPGEVAIRRRELDAVLLSRARECGAEVYEECPVTEIKRLPEGGWHILAGEQSFRARTLVAADGRNSTVARQLGLLPPATRDRVGLQTHLPLPAEVRGRVVMRFLPAGYCGLADIGEGTANLCLVANPTRLPEIKAWATAEFSLPPGQEWRSITPLARRPVGPSAPGLLLTGDAARVVEPFTGEGIYYALASGELAARCLAEGAPEHYAARHRQLYRGRLWVNQFARLACEHPAFASGVLGLARLWPGSLRLLTRKVASA